MYTVSKSAFVKYYKLFTNINCSVYNYYPYTISFSKIDCQIFDKILLLKRVY